MSKYYSQENYNAHKGRLEARVAALDNKLATSALTEQQTFEIGRQISEAEAELLAMPGEWANEQAIANAELTGIDPTIRAAVTWVNSGYAGSGSSLTTNHGTYYTQRGVEISIAVALGLQNEPGNGTAINTSRMRMDERPEIVNLPPEGTTSLQGGTRTTYESANYRNYSPIPWLVIPIINKNAFPVDAAAAIFGHAYSSYTSLSIGLITPNKDNSQRNAIDGWDWQLIGSQYTSNGSSSRTGNFTVPANTTVLFYGQSADRSTTQDTSNNHYHFERELRIDNIQDLFVEGLETDALAIEAIMSRKLTRFEQIWTYTGA